MIQIILVDDHAIIRDGIRSLLQEEENFQVVGEAGDGQQLLDLLEDTSADVVVLDLNMPNMDGFHTLAELQTLHPNVRVLVLSMLDHERYVAQALTAGATGYALKNSGRNELLYAIRAVASGESFLCTAIGMNLLNRLQKTHDSAANEPSKVENNLSKREMEVLSLIAEGLTNAEIADKLFTSRRTIETHRQNIIEKTQAKNTAALIKFAVSSGLLSE